jgi:IS1 family transposase
MNKLPVQTRVQILMMLCEGSSMRSISRITGASINTVDKILRDAGAVCAAFHDEKVRNVKATAVQADEIWSFNYCKAKNRHSASAAPEGAGDVWTFTGIDADSKMILSWLVGSRDTYTAIEFMKDLHARVDGRIQLTTDGFLGYKEAVRRTFGGDVDFGQLVKVYSQTPEGERRYSPAKFVKATKSVVYGEPDEARLSTSYVERQNLTMRMSMRRFTRLTNAFSKRFENHCHALALYFFWYNWTRQHKAHKLSPAMAAGLTDKLMNMSELVQMIDEREAQLRSAKIKARFFAAEAARDKMAEVR